MFELEKYFGRVPLILELKEFVLIALTKVSGGLFEKFTGLY